MQYLNLYSARTFCCVLGNEFRVNAHDFIIFILHTIFILYIIFNRIFINSTVRFTEFLKIIINYFKLLKNLSPNKERY